MTRRYTSKPASADYALREGDTGPAIEASLQDLDGAAVDLTNATEVRLLIRQQQTEDLVVNTAVTIDEAAGGSVSHEFGGRFTTTAAGMHELFWRVHFDGGTVESYPRAEVAYLWVPEDWADGTAADLDPSDAEVGVLTADSLRANTLGGRDTPLEWTSDQDAKGNALQNLGNLGDPGGIASLNDQGVVFSSQIPDLAITDTHTVADKNERLALDVQEGDVAIQQDTSEPYIFNDGDPSVDDNWSLILYPEPPVGSVFGRTGDVTAQSGDYSYSQISGSHGNADHDAAYYSSGDDASFGSLEFQSPNEPTVSATTGSSYDIDVSAASVYILELGGDTSFTFSGQTAGVANSVTLILDQDSTGGRTPSWPSDVVWPDGSEPSWSTGAGETDMVSFVFRPDSNEWLGLAGVSFA